MNKKIIKRLEFIATTLFAVTCMFVCNLILVGLVGINPELTVSLCIISAIIIGLIITFAITYKRNR